MYKYHGPEAVFLAYKDEETGKTLTAKPGETYKISGSPLPPTNLFEEVGYLSAGDDTEQPQDELDRMAGESGVDHTESGE